MEELSRELQEAAEDRRRLVSLAQQWKEELAAVTAERHRTELRLNGRRKDAERLEDERRRLQQTLRTLDFNRENLLREESACRENLKETQERAALQEVHEKQMNDAIGQLQAQWLRVRQEREGRERLVTEARVRLAALEEKQRSLQKEAASLQNEGMQLQRRMEDAAGDDEAVSRQMEELARSLEEDAAILTAAYQSLNEVDDTLNRKKDQQQALEATLREWEGKIRQVRRQGDDLADQLDRIEGDLRETVYGMDNLCRSLEEKHGLDLAAEARAREDRSVSDEELKAREEQLRKDRQAVESFGEVNLLAISEHDQLKERHDFLTAQAADLNGSLGALQRTIARINRISRERFAETFEAVNRCFQDVFSRMFPGGKGALRLTDESDLLETGVEIEIQIPGKKLQNISLLSGGEKSLAALALILAIILYRPTPFLVLDEVDAALDDANVRLFANLVREIAADSQVIMVTHNKSSMEAATNLYGVTMQKKGISTAVSVSLN
jgi:chromosome segregation protein